MGLIVRSVRSSVGREVWWLLASVAFVIFVSTVNVTTYLGSRGRGRVKVWTIWRDVTTDLPGGNSTAVTAGYLIIVTVFVVGSFLALWLTLSADDSAFSSQGVLPAPPHPS